LLLHQYFLSCFLEKGAAAPSWLALLPPNAEGPKGAYVWHDKQIIDWVNGPTPAQY
jgi:carbonyl reductase 1